MTVGEWKEFLKDKDNCRTVFYHRAGMDIILKVTDIGLGCEHFEKKENEQKELFE